MKVFVADPALEAFIQGLERAAAGSVNRADYGGGLVFTYLSYNVPVPPPRPADPQQAALYDAAMARYSRMQQINASENAFLTGLQQQLQAAITPGASTGWYGPTP